MGNLNLLREKEGFPSQKRVGFNPSLLRAPSRSAAHRGRTMSGDGAGTRDSYAWWAVASIVMAACFFLLYARFPMARRPPSPIIFCVVFCEAGLAIAYLMDQDDRNCGVVVFVAQFFEFASQAWRFLVFVDIVCIVRNPYNPDRHWKKYHLVGPALVPSVVRDMCVPRQAVWPAASALAVLTDMSDKFDNSTTE